MRPRLLLLLLSGAFACCVSKEPPLGPIATQQVSTIIVVGHGRDRKGEVVLTDASDIRFVVDHLTGLEAQLYDHSNPEFEVTFETTEGGRLLLRVSQNEVGPDAPASAYNTHWFPHPKDTALYDFLVARTYGAPTN